MTKIVLNGAGSVEFTKELLADILGFDELAGSTIALFDVDGERLETAAAIARWTAGALGAPVSPVAWIPGSGTDARESGATGSVGAVMRPSSLRGRTRPPSRHPSAGRH